MEMNHDVKVEDVSKVYFQGEIEVRALDGVTLTIPEKSFVAVCGPSGSGKTTLLNLIGGLDVPTSGTVTVAGQVLNEMSASELSQLRLNSIGFVFQAYNLIPVLTALENTTFVLQLQGVSARERNERGRSLLAEVGLSGMENRRPGELSGGQQQRVAVARALASDPSIILADEPTANLDSHTASELLEMMRELNEEKEVSFIFSTHDSLVMDYARRKIMLHDGKVSEDKVK